MRLLVRFLGFLFAAGTVVFLVGVAGVAGAIWHFSKDLPDYSQLQDYEPPVMTRVHASDGALLGEYSKERRLYLPIQAMPKLVTNAFLAAEIRARVDMWGPAPGLALMRRVKAQFGRMVQIKDPQGETHSVVLRAYDEPPH